MAGSGSGLVAPAHPLTGRDPRPRKPAKSGPQKGRIFPDFWGLRCSAQGGWGGSAHYPDPTAQSSENVAERRAPRSWDRRGVTGAGPEPWAAKTSKKTLFFFEGRCVFEGEVGLEIDCVDVSVGQASRPVLHPLRGSPTEGLGTDPSVPPRAGALLGARPIRQGATGGRGRHSVPRAAFGYRKRPRLSRNCDTPARDFRPLP